MDALIDREFQQLHHPFQARRKRDFFGRMLAISLALHVISSAILLSPQRSALKVPQVSYLDLKNMQFQEQPAAVQPQEQKAEHVVAPPSQAPPLSVPLSEMEKLQRDVRQSLDNAETNSEALQQRSFGLGLTNGYFSSIAQGETLRGDIREYYFIILREINEKWWLNKNSQQGGVRGAIINIVIARNGTILEKTLTRSSGNPAFDKAMLQTIEAASPLLPLPASYDMDFFSAPLKFVGPLNLFSSLGNGADNNIIDHSTSSSGSTRSRS
jgi:protein TonB